MAHAHSLFVISAITEPAGDQRQLMGCSEHGCGHIEIICRACAAEGRAKSITGSHSHGADGTITRALSFLPQPRKVKPPN